MNTEGSSAPERPSGPGRRVDGKYELLKVLGQGGMGAVYLARNLGTGRQVALKLLLGDAATASPDTLSRFTREALVMGSVDHPNCAQIYDAGRDRDSETGTPYLVMEFLKGEDVSHLIERLGPLPPDLALRLTVQAARGLSAAHAAGVIHRDIKPANLFLARRPDEIVVKVLDFGIGRLLSGEEEVTKEAAKHNVTKTGGTLGSPPYMSPEQVRGSKTLDHRSDLWSLGVSLYQMLCADLPFSHAESLPELLMAVHNGTPAPLTQRAPWVPAEVRAIVERAMCRDLAQRYPNADAMIADMLRLLQGFAGLTEAMLVGLSPQMRASAGAALAAYGAPAGGPTPAAMPSGAQGWQSPASGALAPQMPSSAVNAPGFTAPMPALGLASGTHAAVTSATPAAGVPVSAAAAKKSGAVVGVLVAVAALGVGFGVFALVTRPSGGDSVQAAAGVADAAVDAAPSADAGSSVVAEPKPADAPHGGATAATPDSGPSATPAAGALAAASAKTPVPRPGAAIPKTKTDDPFSNKRTGK